MKGSKFLSIVMKVALVGVALLLTIQNMGRRSELSLDLYFVGAQFSQPQPLPYLLWGGFLMGLAVGVGWSLSVRRKARARIRDLEGSLVRQELGKNPEPATDGWS